MKRLLPFIFGFLALSFAMVERPAFAGAPQAPASQNVSGTVTTGGTFQQIIPSAPGTRAGCLIENPTTASEVLYVFFGPTASATTSNSFVLAAGAAITCGSGPYTVTDAVQVTGATTGHAFIASFQ